jgi:hypothetical protein
MWIRNRVGIALSYRPARDGIFKLWSRFQGIDSANLSSLGASTLVNTETTSCYTQTQTDNDNLGFLHRIILLLLNCSPSTLLPHQTTRIYHGRPSSMVYTYNPIVSDSSPPSFAAFFFAERNFASFLLQETIWNEGPRGFFY